ncbi:MAG: ATP-binding protein [Geminicoccaceae bacterium]
MDAGTGGRGVPLLPWLAVGTGLLSALAAGVAATLTAGFAERMTLARDNETVAQLLNSIVHVEDASTFFLGPGEPSASADIGELITHLGNLPNMLRANAYGRDGTVRWSSDKELIGKRFEDNPELEAAFRGEPVLRSGTVGAEGDKEEHEELGTPGDRFVENYIPIRGERPGEPPVVGVIELYRTPQGLFDSIRASTIRIWIAAVSFAALVYAALVVLLWRAQSLVRRQQAALVSAEKLAIVGEMASAVAHGLRNPLASIRSSAELGLEVDDAATSRGLLTEIVQQADRLEGWIRQYLTSVRNADSGEVRTADPVQVIAAAADAYRSRLARQGVDLAVDLPVHLPPVDVPAVILAQTLNGVLANAAEAQPEGGAVRVAARDDGDRVRVLIEDRGPGLTEAEVRRAFEPFITGKTSGLGLGLPLAREMLQRHGGDLYMRSVPGRGTVVELELRTAPRDAS